MNKSLLTMLKWGVSGSILGYVAAKTIKVFIASLGVPVVFFLGFFTRDVELTLEAPLLPIKALGESEIESIALGGCAGISAGFIYNNARPALSFLYRNFKTALNVETATIPELPVPKVG